MLYDLTRTKTSIAYVKENDREKEREREEGKRRDIEREGEIRKSERERERCEGYIYRESERESHRVQGVRSRRKSSGNLQSGEIKRKERLITKVMTRNYEGNGNYYRALSASILCRGKMWEL